jgi:ATP-dependent DNA ligase
VRTGHDDGQRAGSVSLLAREGRRVPDRRVPTPYAGGHVVGSGVADVVTVPRMGRARRSSEPVERPASLDRSIPFPPMEAELVRELPAGDEWQYEPKWDGFRGLLENASGELRLWSRNARPLLRYFPELEPLGDVLPARSALDGEIVIVRDGVLDFDAMQTRLHPAESRVRKLAAEIPARFVAFDVLVWDGVEHWQAPLAERRATLERVGANLTLSPLTLDLDEALSWLDSFEASGLDGVIAKRRDRPYAPGQRDAVAKVKPEKTADCVVAGIRWKGDREAIATLLLGLYRDDGGLDYVGSAAVAASRHDQIAEQVLPLIDAKSDRRFSEPNRWGTGDLEEAAVKPKLVAEVRYDKVQGNRFRHGTKLLRFRPDKDAAGCTWEQARPKRRPGDPTVEGLLAQASRSG